MTSQWGKNRECCCFPSLVSSDSFFFFFQLLCNLIRSTLISPVLIPMDDRVRYRIYRFLHLVVRWKEYNARIVLRINRSWRAIEQTRIEEIDKVRIQCLTRIHGIVRREKNKHYIVVRVHTTTTPQRQAEKHSPKAHKCLLKDILLSIGNDVKLMCANRVHAMKNEEEDLH